MSWKFAVLTGLVFAVGCGSQDAESPAESEPSSPSEQETAASDSSTKTDFKPITLADCEVFPAADDEDAPKTWSENEAGELVCTGDPRGYLYTKKTYDNFTLEAEFLYPIEDEDAIIEDVRKFNTGFLIFVPEEQKVWPRSLEVQGRFDEMAQIKANARDIEVEMTTFDEDARNEARLPIGQWNRIKIVTRDGVVTSELNGKAIAEIAPTELTSGRIGFQSEGNPVRFRNIRVHRDAKSESK